VTQQDLNEIQAGIKADVSKFASIEEFKDFHKRVTASVEKYSLRMEEFSKDHAINNEMIRRVDELLTLKASKHDLA
jgi:hypothetical protein